MERNILFQRIFSYHPEIILIGKVRKTYVHSYSFQRSTHSNGSGQMTLAHGLLDGQFLSKFRAIVACPHWVPFIAGGRGKCLPSSLRKKLQKVKNLNLEIF